MKKSTISVARGASLLLLTAFLSISATAQEIKGTEDAHDVEARMAAVKRIRNSLAGLVEEINATVKDVDIRLVDARNHVVANEVDRAFKSLNDAMSLLKMAYPRSRIEPDSCKIPGVNEVEFEFDRTATRNTDYRVLSAYVLSATEPTTPVIREISEKATQMRKEAEAEAARGDFPAAITKMTMSTEEYKKIIRSGGFPVR